MKLKVVNAAVVLVGQIYTPALFTPDFVLSTRIVGKDWALAQQPITSPGVSLLKYSNGIGILVEQNRAQVLVDNPPRHITETELTNVAENVLRRLSNTRHTAVGFNIAAIIEYDNATSYLRDKFFKEGQWTDESLRDVTVGLTYTRTDFVLNITYASGIAQYAGESIEHRGIVVTANYHSDLPANLSIDSSSRAAKKKISAISSHFEDFYALMPQVFDLEDENNDAT